MATSGSKQQMERLTLREPALKVCSFEGTLSARQITARSLQRQMAAFTWEAYSA